MILGTATPIQTQVRELWDLLETLGGDAPMCWGMPCPHGAIWSAPCRW